MYCEAFYSHDVVGWLLLQEYITMHGPLNVKIFKVFWPFYSVQLSISVHAGFRVFSNVISNATILPYSTVQRILTMS